MRCGQEKTNRRKPAVALGSLLAFVVPHTAAAQGRLDERVLVPDRVEGLSAGQLRQMVGDLGRIAAVLRANAGVASLPGAVPCAGIDTGLPERLTEGDRGHVGGRPCGVPWATASVPSSA